jgi:hypothetical protein
MDGGWVKGWMDCFEFTYMIEWVLEGVSFSPNEILTMETISQDFPDIQLISEALGSITSWGSFLS